MAIINNSFSFIFVHVPKTGGTSVTDFFSRFTNYCDLEIGGTPFGERMAPHYANRFGLRKHSTAAEIRAVVGSVTWSKYYTFSFVRNPFLRCLSTYNFLKSWNHLPAKFKTIFDEFHSFDDFVLSGVWDKIPGPDGIFRPQIAWLRSRPTSSDLIVDYVGKIEHPERDLRNLSRAILPLKANADFTVNHRNRSTGATMSQLTSSSVIDAIVEKYREDFAIFGYSEDPAMAVPAHV